jgi:hypothetical protein
LVALADQFRWLEELTRQHLTDPAILDLRPQLARAKALYDVYLRRADFSERGDPNEFLRALAATETVVKIGNLVVKAQRGIGAIQPEDLQQLIHIFRLTIREFIPPEQYRAAEQFMREAANELAARQIRQSLGGPKPGE